MLPVSFIFAEAHCQTNQSNDQRKQSDACFTPAQEGPTASAARHTSSTSPPPSEKSQKMPFGCGCGNCTICSFIERGCPTPLSSESTFPYLNLSGFTPKQQEDLRERLRCESQQIMSQFQNLVSRTASSLIKRNVPRDELVIHIMNLKAFDMFSEQQVPLFQDYHKKLEAADTILKVFIVLHDYISFFNYDIIEHIINVLGTDEDKAELQNYKIKFDQYARRRIYECGPHFGPEGETDHSNIFVKLDLQFDSYTVAEIKCFCHKLSKILGVSSKGVLRLCQIKMGCIQLILQVPLSVQQKIFPLSREQERTLKTKGVIKLTCGEYQLPDFDELSQQNIDASGKFVHVTIYTPIKAS